MAIRELHAVGRDMRQRKRLIDAAIHETLDTLVTNHAVRRAFIQVLQSVRSNSQLLKPSILSGPATQRRLQATLQLLIRLAEVRTRWLREPQTWSSDECNFNRLLRSLVDHLLVRETVPEFLYSAWLEDDPTLARKGQKLFIHLARGNRLRGLKLPFPWSETNEFAFLSAPDHFGVNVAFARAAASDLKRFEAERKMRFPIATSRRRRKKLRIDRNSLGKDVTWRAAKIGNFRQVETDPRGWSHRVWTIQQITSRSRLHKEGATLSHCVGSYWQRCAEGETTIWSMQCAGTITRRHVLTAEVDPDGRKIKTVLGERNRHAKPSELDVLDRWAKNERLQLAPFYANRLRAWRNRQVTSKLLEQST